MKVLKKSIPDDIGTWLWLHRTMSFEATEVLCDDLQDPLEVLIEDEIVTRLRGQAHEDLPKKYSWHNRPTMSVGPR